VHGSLFGAAADAGLDQRTIMNLVDIFAWDIDFARDMRDGDTFHVLYEERFDDEGKPLDSRILAAEFTNQGKTYKAVRYKQLNGNVDYFSPDGKSMRKAYLRAPLKFSRISSRFKLKRKHPVLGYNRAHRGVDYAAASGTPIHAIGDGHIAYIGWKGGYGRFILIRHNNRNHSTAYAHMRRFARGMKKGKRVKQGQIIGYVGMSGLATGPHLHFEFRSRGRAVNPLTVKHPPAKPVLKTERIRFHEQTAPLLSRLKNSTSQPNWG
jgi:murein DD-endopeptidase MepM/ murein hydrolase activator NlpD